MASPAQVPLILCFGAFELNAASGELHKSGIPIKIGPQPFRVLLLFAEHPRQVITRKEIQHCLWGDGTFVDYERGINFCVNQIRAALGDDAEEPRYIETLPRRGYRFIVPVSRQIPDEPGLRRAPAPIVSEAQPDPADPRQAAAHPLELQLAREAETRAHRGISTLIVAFSVASIVFGIYRLSRYARLPRHEPRLAPLTANSPDNPITSSAISPDGKYLAFTDHSGRMRVRLLATGETRTVPEPQALTDAPLDWTIARWFPDSTRFLANARSPASLGGILDRLRFGIKFHRFSLIGASERRSVWSVSVLSASPQKLRDDAEAFSASPDGSQVAFGTNSDHLGDREIWLMDSTGQGAHKLLEATKGTALAGFNWSQEGNRAIYFRFGEESGELLSHDLRTGRDTMLVSFPDEEQLGDFTWLPDGRLIYVRADNALARSCNLWELRIDSLGRPVGTPQRLTNWSGFCAAGMSLTSDGKRLAFQRTNRQTTVSIADLDANEDRISRVSHLTLNEYVNEAETWTPDSKALVFRSLRDGHEKLFKQALDSGVEEPLVSGAEGVGGSAISPDGSWLFYLACGAATDDCGDDPVPVMRTPISGGTSYPVLTSATSGRPRCAVAPATLCVVADGDGKLIRFTAFDAYGPGAELATFEKEGSEYMWSLSPDGARIALLRHWDNRIHILSLRGQAPSVVTVSGERHLLGVYWAADSKSWFTARMSPSGAVLLHVDLRGQARPIWELRGDTVAYSIPSPDRRHLAIVATERTSNVWVISDLDFRVRELDR